jgi:CMP-N-acetylneuraminic acid synthetase
MPEVIFFLTPYPGTELYEMALKQNKISDEERYLLSLDEQGEKIAVNFTDFSDEQLYKIQADMINVLGAWNKMKHGAAGISTNIVGIIPARGGSKRLKDKNILELNGKPLIGYTIEAALASQLLDRVIVSTDSDRIAEIVRHRYGVQVIKRPPELAQDDSPIEDALLHVVEYLKQQEGYSTNIVVLMQANVPIRQEGIVDETLRRLLHSGADACVTCVEADHVPEVMKIINEKGRLIPLFVAGRGIRKQEFPKRYLVDGSVLALRVENLIRAKGVRKTHIYFGEEVLPLIQKKKMYALEIDTEDDFALAKYYMDQLNRKKALA